MNLDGIVKDDGTGNLKRHTFILERPWNSEKIRFRASLNQVAKLGRILQKTPTEMAVLEWYQNNPYRLPVSYEDDVPEIIKIEQEYYWNNDPTGFKIQRGEVTLQLYHFSKIDISYYRGEAVKNLYGVIKDEGLSLLDRQTIKDIALRWFYHGLEQLMDSPSEEMSFSALFNRIGSNEAALAELERYGFKVESPKVKRFDGR